MTNSSTSFWTEIKKYEDILAKDQSSYCFAPLSELYRKLGLLDDAVTVARRGSAIHPDYVGGYMALGRALYDKKEFAEARISLEKVVRATPENLLAQKLLSQIYQNEGDVAAARHALQLLVDFNPEDVESRIMLDSLRDHNGVVISDQAQPSEPSQDVLGLDARNVTDFELNEVAAHKLDENSDVVCQIPLATEETNPDIDEVAISSSINNVPVSTVTLAELYESQGYSEEALRIYTDLLSKDPDNTEISQRIMELRSLTNDNPEILATCHEKFEEFVASPLDEEGYLTSPSAMNDVDDALLRELESFLHSIQRRRECLFR